MGREHRMRRRGAIALAATALAVCPPTAGAADPASETIYSIQSPSGNLVAFASTTGAITRQLAVAGLLPGDRLRGVDFRPSTGQLYGIGIPSHRLYRVNPVNGGATLLTGALPVSDAADVEVNPTSDVLRVVSTNGSNLRVDPDTGSTVGIDTPLGAGVSAAGATNAVDSATFSTLYGLAGGSLVRIGGLGGFPSPNGGAATTVGALGLSLAPDAGLDVSGATGKAYTLVEDGGRFLALVDLHSGAATKLAAAPGLAAVAVAPPAPAFRFAAATLSAVEGSGVARVPIRRVGLLTGSATVTYTTVDGSARDGADYRRTSASVGFAAGETLKTISIPIVRDSRRESLESFSVQLTGGAPLARPSQAIVTIFDDDADPAPPVVLASSPTQITLRSALRGLRVKTSCSAACRLDYSVRLSRRRLGTARKRTSRPGIASLRVRLSRSGQRLLRRALRRRSRTVVTLTVTARSDGGRATDRLRIAVTRR
jgi:hypothetical protein